MSSVLWFSENIFRIEPFFQDKMSSLFFLWNLFIAFFLIESQAKIDENFSTYNNAWYFIDNKVIDDGLA